MRRLLPGREPAGRWWDVDFLPLRATGEKAAVFILGRITVAAADEAAPAVPMPERLVALRERMTQRFGPELLSDTSPALRRLAEQVRLAGRTTAPVLLVGEPGVGKRTLARLIHYQSPHRERPFAALDCDRLPAGRSRTCCSAVYAGPSGRFTFTTRRACRVTCNYASAKSFMPRPKKTPCARARILAGCGVDPAEEVRAGRLLDELYSALAVLTIAIPPLRERRADLPALVDRMLQRGNDEGETQVKGLSADAWDVVREHAWPGNLRELYAVLSSARRRAEPIASPRRTCRPR